MSTTLIDFIKAELFYLLDETFEKVQGIYLDKGTSLFETLEGISAEQASRPVSETCASIAAQVDHTRFYLDVIAGHMRNQPLENVNWNEIWETVGTVNEAEWQAIIDRLKASYQAVRELMNGFDTWEGENDIAGPLEIIVHTAFHLGQIRQALCTVK